MVVFPFLPLDLQCVYLQVYTLCHWVLERWFLDSLGCEEDRESGEASSGDDSTGDSTDEAGDDALPLSELVDPIGCLIPLLPDVVVREQIWSALMSPPSVPLLLRLRHVSKSWDSFVVTTVEWNVWTLVRLDSPGYLRYYAADRVSYRPFSQRFNFEIANFRFLVTEDMEEIAYRLRYLRLNRGVVPFYVSTEGCLPSFELCPKYYGL